LDHERERDLWLAWHIVALERARRLPRLKRLLHPPATRRLEGEEKAKREREFEELTKRMGIRY